jgi:hypothetical protein
MSGGDVRTENSTLDQLRALVREDPTAGLDALRRHLDHSADPVGGNRVDLRLVLAETWQRLGEWREALHAADFAAELATSGESPDRWRLLAAVGIGADVAVCTRDRYALDACQGYYAELQEEPQEDLAHSAIGAALRALAIYQRRGCDEGRQKLRILHTVLQREAPRYDELLDSVRLGMAAMDDGCAIGCVPAPPGPLPPLPGGVLAPDPGRPDPDWLARRVALHEPTHTCAVGTFPATTSAVRQPW